MQKGTVSYFNADRGFGFITPDSKKATGDVFVHVTSVLENKPLAKDQRVWFDVRETERGPAAVNVVEAN